MLRSLPAVGHTLIVGLRLAFLILAAAAVVVALSIGAPRDHASGDPGERYACAMHPQVEADGPGTCPICQMALERAAAGGPRLSPQDLGVVTRRLVGGERGEVRAPSWIESDDVVAAVVYDDVLLTLGPNMRGTFLRAGASAGGVSVRLLPDPPVTWDRSTSRVRFHIDRPPTSALAPRRGEVGYVLFSRRSSEVLVVPSSAVIQAPDGPYVLAPSTNGRSFVKRPVRTGGAFAGLTVVLWGVRDQEVIVGRNVFFPDAERRRQSTGAAREAAR